MYTLTDLRGAIIGSRLAPRPPEISVLIILYYALAFLMLIIYVSKNKKNYQKYNNNRHFFMLTHLNRPLSPLKTCRSASACISLFTWNEEVNTSPLLRKDAYFEHLPKSYISNCLKMSENF